MKYDFSGEAHSQHRTIHPRRILLHRGAAALSGRSSWGAPPPYSEDALPGVPVASLLAASFDEPDDDPDGLLESEPGFLSGSESPLSRFTLPYSEPDCSDVSWVSDWVSDCPDDSDFCSCSCFSLPSVFDGDDFSELPASGFSWAGLAASVAAAA